jgi:dihydrofolate synthase/folylpolyglutamate synthase
VGRHLARLESLDVRGIKLGLAAIDALCERLGRPERAFPSVLVGGTNGKGSTAATLASIAEAAGKRSGLYTSPHLISVTERVRVGPADVSVEALDEALGRVFAAADAEPAIPATYFEAMTAAAFWLFRETGVDVAVLEVGLGGRFDATNVSPAGLSIVTSIALDHTAELGDTLPRIAFEKAGIFRRDRPALFRSEDPEARAELARAAEAADALGHDATREVAVDVREIGVRGTVFETTTPERRLQLRTPLPGAHQAWNAALAVRGAELYPEAFGSPADETLERGVAGVRWAGRLERIARPGRADVILDGCHNPDGARALARWLDDSGLAGRARLVFGAMADKDVEGIAAAIFPKASEVVLVLAGASRGATPDELLRRVGPLARRARIAPDARAALELLDSETGAAAGAGPPIIVAGSLYLVGDARAGLLGSEARGTL